MSACTLRSNLDHTAPPPCDTEACCGDPDCSRLPSSYGYYDNMYSVLDRTNFANSTRVGLVEVVHPADICNIHATHNELALLRIFYIAGFSSMSRENGTSTLSVGDGDGGLNAFAGGSGVLMAMHHFNNGIGSVVSAASGINQTCPIRMVIDNLLDSESSQARTVPLLNEQIMKSPDRPPSAIIGADRSVESIVLATLSGTYGIPQISPASTSTELDDTTQYPLFSRLIPSDGGTARAVVNYLAEIGLRHLGIIYVNDSYGSSYVQAVSEAATDRRDPITVKAVSFHYSRETTNQIKLAIEQLAATEYRYFFGVFYGEHYELVMDEAFKQSIVGNEFVWLLSDGVSPTYFNGRQYESEA